VLTSSSSRFCRPRAFGRRCIRDSHFSCSHPARSRPCALSLTPAPVDWLGLSHINRSAGQAGPGPVWAGLRYRSCRIRRLVRRPARRQRGVPRRRARVQGDPPSGAHARPYRRRRRRYSLCWRFDFLVRAILTPLPAPLRSSLTCLPPPPLTGPMSARRELTLPAVVRKTSSHRLGRSSPFPTTTASSPATTTQARTAPSRASRRSPTSARETSTSTLGSSPRSLRACARSATRRWGRLGSCTLACRSTSEAAVCPRPTATAGAGCGCPSRSKRSWTAGSESVMRCLAQMFIDGSCPDPIGVCLAHETVILDGGRATRTTSTSVGDVDRVGIQAEYCGPRRQGRARSRARLPEPVARPPPPSARIGQALSLAVRSDGPADCLWA